MATICRVAGTTLTPEQQKVLNALLAGGSSISDQRTRDVYNRAAVETGLVESGLTNPSGGDADSENWRQERKSAYGGEWAKTGGAQNLTASVARFRQEFLDAYKPGAKSYDVAAAVQRPAEAYRGRYQDVASQAAAILQAHAGSGSDSSTSNEAPSAVPGLTSGDPGQSADATALLATLGQQQQRPVASAASLPTPAAVAGPALPAAYKALSSGQAPAAKTDISPLLAQVTTPGQAAANVAASASPLVAEASSGGASAPSTGTGGAQAALGWAQSKVGFKETGTNSGGLASYLNSRFGMSNQPWCAMFTSAAVTKGGAPAAARTASVAEVRRQAQQGGGGYQKGFVAPAKAKAGDLITFGDDHIAMVQRVDKGRVYYVGGNQSDGVTESSVPVGHGDIVRPLYGSR